LQFQRKVLTVRTAIIDVALIVGAVVLVWKSGRLISLWKNPATSAIRQAVLFCLGIGLLVHALRPPLPHEMVVARGRASAVTIAAFLIMKGFSALNGEKRSQHPADDSTTEPSVEVEDVTVSRAGVNSFSDRSTCKKAPGLIWWEAAFGLLIGLYFIGYCVYAIWRDVPSLVKQ